MTRKWTIPAGAALSVLIVAGAALARLHSGRYTINYPGSECRELHTGSEGRGRFCHAGQGYEASDPKLWMQVFCPIWHVEQLDLGRHRWDWTPGPGVIVFVGVTVIDNHPDLNTTCWLHTGDSLDWDGDNYADWDASESSGTSGTGLHRLTLHSEGRLYRMRDGFLALRCEVPPVSGEHARDPTRIAGYRMTMTRVRMHAN